MSPEIVTLLVTRVARSTAATWSDMPLDEATLLVDAALSGEAAYTGPNHYRSVMTSAMLCVSPSLSEYVADYVVDCIENELGSIRTAERYGL